MKKLVLLMMLIASSNILAGDAAVGTLRLLHFMGNGVVIAYTDGTRTDVPVCALNQPSRFALDGTTASGKVQLTGLLTAYSMGKQVLIFGAGSCSAYSDTETIRYFRTAE